MPQENKKELMLEERKVKALEKIANVLDALTLWFEDIDSFLFSCGIFKTLLFITVLININFF